MIIQQTHVRNLEKSVAGVREGEEFTFGIRVTGEVEERLPTLGFADDWVEGETVLPPATGGPASRRNAEGDVIVHRDQPMETAYREFEWEWEEYHGPYDRVRQSDIVFQPYKRYPRTQVPPAGIELTTVTTDEGRRMLVAARTFRRGEDEEAAKAAVNLLLELFGEAEVLHGDLTAFSPMEVRRVNWEVLPEGTHPWATLAPKVEEVLRRQGPRKRGVYEHRWRTITDYEPDFSAVGRAGFAGYVIFGFTDRSLYVLESAHYGNATYVLDADWAALSQLTKAELLAEDLHRDRIIHRDDWEKQIRELLDEGRG